MKKAKIALASIALLGIAGSIVAFKSARSKSAPAYFTFTYNKAAAQTFTRASAIQPSAAAPGVYYTLTKNSLATLYSSLVKNQ